MLLPIIHPKHRRFVSIRSIILIVNQLVHLSKYPDSTHHHKQTLLFLPTPTTPPQTPPLGSSWISSVPFPTALASNHPTSYRTSCILAILRVLASLFLTAVSHFSSPIRPQQQQQQRAAKNRVKLKVHPASAPVFSPGQVTHQQLTQSWYRKYYTLLYARINPPEANK